MTLCALLLDGGGLKFDWTINIGNVAAAAMFLLLAAVAWTDLRWRVKNLEVWQAEHKVESKQRDEIIQRIDRLLERVEGFIGMSDQRKMGTVRTRKDDL